MNFDKKNLILPIFIFVFFSISISAIFAAPLGESGTYTISSSGLSGTAGISGSITGNTGDACTSNSGCQSNYCCSSVCSASACPTSTTSTSTSSGTTVTTGSSGSTGATTTTTPTTTTQPSVPTTTTVVIITDTGKVQEIIKGVDPSSLGVTEVTANKVEVKQTATAEKTVTSTQAEASIDSVLSSSATSSQAKEALQEIKSQVSSGASTGVTITAKLEVYEVKSTDTGKTTTVSKINLQFKADKDSKNVKIIENIPKSVAADVAEIIFTGVVPTILQADPIVQWQFDEVKQGETKDLSYIVKKKLDLLNTTTIAAAQTVETAAVTPAKPFEIPIIVYAIVAILIIAAIVWKIGLLEKLKRGPQRYSFRN